MAGSTFFTEPPHWNWLIVLYFFIGGLAGGSYFIAALIDVAGRAAERPLARLGYLVAFPAVVVCGILLIFDLTRPLRFWHMLLQSETLRPMLKTYSPMSLGAWGLLFFGGFALLSFVGALAAPGSPLRSLRPPSPLGWLVTGVGGLFAFFLAGYTGVLLAVTNRPIWSDTPLLGLTFLVSSASTSIALLLLLGARRAWAPALIALRRLDIWVLILELIVVVALVASLGGVARAWLNAWGALLAVGVVGIGIVVPLVLNARSRAVGGLGAAAAAALVLLGGFLLRLVIVMSAQGV
jgi:formate-dependent nitrite reductase membrane component NrfD